MKHVFFFILFSSSISLINFPIVFAKSTQPIQADVTLSPLGSFELTCKKVFGKAKKKGDAYIAKELRVPVNMLKTGMSLRDKHLKEKLEFQKHKYITATKVRAKGGQGQAILSIKGISKPIKFRVKDLGNGSAQAQFEVDLTQYNIKGISYQGVGVKDIVKVQAVIPYDEVTGK